MLFFLLLFGFSKYRGHSKVSPVTGRRLGYKYCYFQCGTSVCLTCQKHSRLLAVTSTTLLRFPPWVPDFFFSTPHVKLFDFDHPDRGGRYLTLSPRDTVPSP